MEIIKFSTNNVHVKIIIKKKEVTKVFNIKKMVDVIDWNHDLKLRCVVKKNASCFQEQEQEVEEQKRKEDNSDGKRHVSSLAHKYLPRLSSSCQD